MSDITRRAILRGSPAAAIAAAAITSLPAGGAAASPILALAAERQALQARLDALLAESLRLEATLPPEFDAGPGKRYPYPAALPPELLARYEAFRQDSGLVSLGAASDEVCDRLNENEAAICRTPAATLAELRAKLRVAVASALDGLEGPASPAAAYAWESPDGVLSELGALVMVWADVERLVTAGED
jgi:hypothetical protein